ncbi:MAG: S8 family peptidase, partial [Isosphaeraceae bacterium]
NLSFHASASIAPNDPKAAEQWGLGMIDARAAGGVTTGSPSTIVAVLDTGIDVNSPEFAGRLWVNPNASNRFRTVHGWNFVDNNTNVTDTHGHGTHVAAIIAAAGNDGIGVAGLNWNATIMPLKVLDARGDGSTDKAVSAIYFAVDNGAKVINASWGGDTYSQAMFDALNYANSKGVVFVTAAGNEGVNNDVVTSYPASYRLPNVLSVASVDRYGNLAYDSNHGGGTVDLAAPGVDVLSAIPGGFATYSGTSMATAFVSGTVSLLAGLRPDLSAASLVDRVRSAVKPLPSLAGKTISGGVVDPYEVLKHETPVTITLVAAPTSNRSASTFPRFASYRPVAPMVPTRRPVRWPVRRPLR